MLFEWQKLKSIGNEKFQKGVFSFSLGRHSGHLKKYSSSSSSSGNGKLNGLLKISLMLFPVSKYQGILLVNFLIAVV